MQQFKDPGNILKKSKERPITIASKKMASLEHKTKTTKTRKQKWEEKQMYGYFT